MNIYTKDEYNKNNNSVDTDCWTDNDELQKT